MNQDKPEAPKEIPSLKDDKIIDAQSPKLETPPSQDKAKDKKPPKEAKKKPGTMTLAFRWFFVLLIALGLGVVLTLFSLYLPARRDLERVNNQLQQSDSEYSSELREANQEIERLSSLETTNKELQSEVEQKTLYITLLQIRVDVLTAQTSVSDGDYSKASLALSKTPDRLTQLAKLLPSEQRDAIEALQTRLQLALEEIEKSDSAAKSDLDVLATKLLELEDAIIR